jgi:cellobiose dehydrogenase (acceptor)
LTDSYLDQRSGILAQAAPNIGPVFFDEIKGADGIVRSLSWTARVEASLGFEDIRKLQPHCPWQIDYFR